MAVTEADIDNMSEAELDAFLASSGPTTDQDIDAMSEQELDAFLAEPPKTFGEELSTRPVPGLVTGAAEAVGSIATSGAAEVLGGIGGLVSGARGKVADATGIEAIRDDQNPGEVVRSIQNMLTFQPRTDEGKFLLQSLGNALRPLTDKLEAAEQASGNALSEGSGLGLEDRAALNAVGQTAPTAALTALGGVVSRVIPKRAPEAPDAVEQAPEVPQQAEPAPTQAVATVEDVENTAQTLRQGTTEEVAIDARPDVEALEAADRLDINAPAGSFATNPAFIEVNAALKSKPGSPIAAQEIQAISDLGDRADSLIENIGGTLDRAEFDSNLREDMLGTITSLEGTAGRLYDAVRDSITPRQQVQVSDAKQFVEERLKDLNGDESLLSPSERQLQRLGDTTTYAALDAIRKRVGAGYNGKGPFKDEETATLNRVYGLLSDIQQKAADSAGVGAEYAQARASVAKRKDVENASLGLFGKDLNASVSPKIRGAATQLAQGNLGPYRKLLADIPANRRKDAAVQVMAELFAAGNRSNPRLGGGFSSAFVSLNRNAQAKKALFDQLTPQARNTFDDLGKVSVAVFRAKSRDNNSRTARDVLAMFDNPEFIGRMVGTAKDVARAEAVTFTGTGGVPGLGAGYIGLQRLFGERTTEVDAAIQLLGSDDMRRAIQRLGEGNVIEADQTIAQGVAFKEWARINPREAKTIAAIGFGAWLIGGDASPTNSQETPDQSQPAR